MKKLSRSALESAFAGIADQLSETDALRTRVDGPRYTDIRKIGEGGAKHVYLCRDEVSGREVVRVFPKSEELHDSFVREAILQARLQHANIIPLYDLGFEEDRPFFCLKHIEGEDLEDWVRQNLEPDDSAYFNVALDLFIGICKAIQYAHGLGVQHLDLKPANVRITSGNQVLVGDWGLARAEFDLGGELPEYTGQFSLHGYLSGSPGYMAPEQCKKGAVKDAQTDVYALGALLVFLFSGQPPISGKVEQVLSDTLRGAIKIPSAGMPERLAAIARKALALEPADRYRSASELIDDIQAFRAGKLTSVEDNSVGAILRSLFRQHPTLTVVSASALFLVLALSATYSVVLNRARHTADQARIRAEQALVDLSESRKQRKQDQNQFASYFLDESIRYYRNRLYGETAMAQGNRKAYEAIKAASPFYEGQPEDWALRGRLAFINLEFADAVDSFEKAGPAYEQHLELARLAASMNSTENDDLATLIPHLATLSDLRFFNNFVFGYMEADIPPRDKVPVLEATLRYRAHRYHGKGDDDTFNFHWDEATASLDLSGNTELRNLPDLIHFPLQELDLSGTAVSGELRHLQANSIRRLNLSRTKVTSEDLRRLAPCPVEVLDVTDTAVRDVSFLPLLPLTHLNVRGCAIDDFEGLAKSETLAEIRCSPEQFEAIQAAVRAHGKAIRVIAE